VRIDVVRKSAQALRPLALGALVALAGACGPTMSQIETGKVVTTNDAAFDDFFKAVVALREDSLAAEKERKAAYAELAKALGLTADADVVSLLDTAAQTAKKLDGEGVSMHLELTPEPKLCVLASKRPKGGSDPEALSKAVETAVKTSLGLAKRMGDVAVRSKELEKQRLDLAGKPAAKKGSIEDELTGAQKVLAETRERATNEGGLASSFIVSLALALETGAADTALARFTGKTGKPMGGGRPGAGAGQGSPTPKPKPSDDFEP